MKKFKVFNIEFDGMDKSGKDSIMRQIFSCRPNMYIPKSRGIMSQIAYGKMFNRDYEYELESGYCKNTLFVYLTVNEDDWNIRCDLTNEHALNEKRKDVESKITYNKSNICFEYAYEYILKYFKENGISEDHIMKFNTSEYTPVQIIKLVCERLDKMNQ